MDDTIVAIATPLGEGGLGVVRLSGPQAVAISEKIFRSKVKLSDATTHTIHHGWIKKLDEAVAAVFRAPHSYTGEDVVELSCHGSPSVLKETVRLCLSEGARAAGPGEFTQRAYLNGKLDLLQAEAVADLIHARSTKAGAAAAAQLHGVLSARLNDIRQKLIDLVAQIEANLDFVEERLPIISQKEITGGLEKVKKMLSDLLNTSMKGRILREGLRVALAGRPNVGKSSLFNALLAEDRAIVTDVPGTTRDTLEEKLEWNGMPVVLVDTAGLRAKAGKIEAQGVSRAKREQEKSDVVLLVLDSNKALSSEDKKILELFKKQRLVVALNKSDKPQKIKPASLPEWVRARCVNVSAKTGDGLAQLKDAVMKAIGSNASETEDATIITNERHIQHLEKASKKLAAAIKAAQEEKSEEALALDLRSALENLSAITGENADEQVLSSIFRQFCIGK